MQWYTVAALALLAGVASLLAGVGLGTLFMTFLFWCGWKRREIRARAEWTQSNPYWREAFDAGADWADAGRPAARPNLTRLKPPWPTSAAP